MLLGAEQKVVDLPDRGRTVESILGKTPSGRILIQQQVGDERPLLSRRNDLWSPAEAEHRCVTADDREGKGVKRARLDKGGLRYPVLDPGVHLFCGPAGEGERED